MLVVENLTKQYVRSGRNFDAVSNVDLTVEKGEFINIIGRSGSGKTTLLNMLSGLISPTTGSVIIDGEKISDKTDEQLSIARNEKIGYVPQIMSLIPTLTVIENIALPFFLYKREGDVYGKARVLMSELGIEGLADSFPKELSGGEQRRTLFARALINDPAIIIADEPTSDLDFVNTKGVMNLLSKINEKNITVVMVSHEPDTLSYGNKIYTMEGGILKEGKHLGF